MRLSWKTGLALVAITFKNISLFIKINIKSIASKWQELGWHVIEEKEQLNSDLHKADERLNHLSKQIKSVKSEKISLLLGYTCGTTTQKGKIHIEEIEYTSNSKIIKITHGK